MIVQGVIVQGVIAQRRNSDSCALMFYVVSLYWCTTFVHVLLYMCRPTCTEKPGQIARAETQFEIATSFDTRYADVRWVVQEKNWPPRLADALDRFLRLA